MLRCVRVTIVVVEKHFELLIVSVSAALVIRHAMRMRHIVICSLTDSTVCFHII